MADQPPRPNSTLSIITDTAALHAAPALVGITISDASPGEANLPSQAELDEARRLTAETEVDDLQEVKEALRKVLSVADSLVSSLALTLRRGR